MRNNKKLPGLADKLNYLFFADEYVVLNKSNSLTAYYLYRGEDLDNVNASTLNNRVNRWNAGLCSAFSRCNIMVEYNVLRFRADDYPNDNNFPDVVSALIDQERNFIFTQGEDVYKSYTLFSFTYEAQKEVSSAAKKFIYGDAPSGDEKLEDTLKNMYGAINVFISYVSRGENTKRFKLLNKAEVYTWLHACMTHELKDTNRELLGDMIDQNLATFDINTGKDLIIRDKYIGVLHIENFPDAVCPCILDTLNNLPIEYRWNVRYFPMPRDSFEGVIKKYSRAWANKKTGFKGAILKNIFNRHDIKENQDALEKEYEMDEIKRQTDNNEMRHGLYSSNIFVFAKTEEELSDNMSRIDHELSSIGFGTRNDRNNRIEAYFGSLPAHGKHNVRNHIIDSKAWAYMCPLSVAYQGNQYHPHVKGYGEKQPCLMQAVTKGNNVYYFNNFVGDVGHTLVVGSTGFGKTTFTKLMIAQMLKYKDACIVGFDCDNSHRDLIKVLGGDYYDIAKDDTVSIQPFSDVDDPYEFEIAKSWLEEILTLHGVNITTSISEELSYSLHNIAMQPKHLRRFSTFIDQINHSELARIFKTLADKTFKRILDGDNDNIMDNNIMLFERSAITQLDKKVYQPILSAISNKLEKKINQRKPTLWLEEEVHTNLTASLQQRLKRYRKKNVSILMNTQELQDITSSDIGLEMISAAQTKVYIPIDQNNEFTHELYYKFGLNKQQIDLLMDGTPKQDYFVVNSQGARMINLVIGEIQSLFLFSDASKESSDYILSLYNKDDPRWVIEFLKHYDQHEVAEFVAENLLDKE